METPLHADDQTLEQFCRNHHIRKLSLFGSVLTGKARPDSDVDLLVEFETGMAPGLLGMAQMEAELSRLFGSRRVDLRTANDLSRYFRSDVLSHAQVQYAR